MGVISLLPEIKAESVSEIALGRITCRVCGLAEKVGVGHPALLCHMCLEDLDKTRERVRGWLDNILAQLDGAANVWLDTRNASEALPQWNRVEDARAKVDLGEITQEQFGRQWAKRKAEKGALAKLMVAWERYVSESERLGIERQRLELAQKEINTASLALEVI